MQIELESTTIGHHISTVCEEAIALAKKENAAVHFIFNGTDVIAEPTETPRVVMERWSTDREAAQKAWIESPEYAAREAQRAADTKAAREAHMTEPANTEEELRESETPRPITESQLIEYINSLITKNHTYGTCVYAMSMAAEAAFNLPVNWV